MSVFVSRISAFKIFSISAFSKKSPLFPRNPFFPTSGLTTGTLKGLNPKSKFLTFTAKLTVVGGRESQMIRTAGDGFVSSHG